MRTDVFGGSVEVTNLFAENLFSKARKVGFDLFFRDIDLETVTGKVALGKMTGIIKGSIANFVMEYGQPARFFLDLESDPTKNVSQVISVAAVENLSILGTGSGAISSVLNSGVQQALFKEYPYSRIGNHLVILKTIPSPSGEKFVKEAKNTSSEGAGCEAST